MLQLRGALLPASIVCIYHLLASRQKGGAGYNVLIKKNKNHWNE
jgi:hypothetical protein